MASSPRIEELQRKFDENPRRYFAPLANEYRKIGDIDQAIFICQEYLPQQPGHMSGHIVFGQALFEARRFDEAKAVFETALTLDPENLIALRHLGDIAREQGDLAGARSWYLRVLDADPRNEEIAGLLSSLDTPAAADGGAAAEAASPPAAPDAAPSALPEPVIDVPLETEPTESPLADFAAIVDEVRAEGATGKPEAPAAELTVPHASADSEPLDLDVLDLSFGNSAPSAPAAPSSEPAAPASSAAIMGAPAAAPAPAPAPEAEPPSPAAPPVAASEPSGPAAGIPVLEGLEATEFHRHGDAATVAPLDGLDVLEGSFSLPLAEPPGRAPEPPAPQAAAPAAPAPELPAPAAAAPSAPAAAMPALHLDEDLDALFEVPAAPAAAAPPAPPAPTAQSPGAAAPEPAAAPPAPVPQVPPASEPAARPAAPPVIGHRGGTGSIEPLPPEPPPKTPAWGMPDVEVPGWEIAVPPPPPTPEIPIPTVPPRPSTEVRATSVADTESHEPEAASGPAPFVTETMAELYVKQGHRDEAIGVYRQLVAERPNDESLRLRLAELESLAHAEAEAAAQAASAASSEPRLTIREYLAALAAQRPRSADDEPVPPGAAGPSGEGVAEGGREYAPPPEAFEAKDGSFGATQQTSADTDDAAESEHAAAPLDGLPVLEDTWDAAAPSVTPPARPTPRDSGTVGGSLDLLFSNTEARAEQRSSRGDASSQDGARPSGPREAAGGDFVGRPARPAATELSLDTVFREPTPSKGQESSGFSFDQFFSDGASDRGSTHATPDQAGPPQPGAGTDDIEQFNAWLEGLKKS